MTRSERQDFRAYLRSLTDAQVRGCLQKESLAGRDEEADLCEAELEYREKS